MMAGESKLANGPGAGLTGGADQAQDGSGNGRQDGSGNTAGEGLELSGVNKVYQARRGEVTALSDVNLHIRSREFISLVGRSGCGKTTLLRILAGLEAPSSGTVRADGLDVWSGTRRGGEALAKFGVVFQEANLFPWYTVQENVVLPLKLRGAGKAERRAEAERLCALVGLGGFENAYPRELSGGMRQRAAIARALSYQPSVLLMDEPFGALDALTRDKMNLELQSIHAASGATIVFVTHSISEAVFLADRVVLLTPRPGRIRSVTPVAFERPRSLDTQSNGDFQQVVRALRHELDEES
ncbi:ABC transporter ATP-binding protein [Streptomyces sp. TS71-3]|uniref:ABC transporter ATP-binding protein n=1 Tax=Streptomyces sp. TS71-3 TaxID=2733862 RepID=UPI001B20B4D5|nr:ABC transporter ATP-binding protein [Streptomyces sp. TS71-3]GHJ40912.1 ABC transporter ATP-binding protein [Streptomyces sp. TS71-3]